MSSTKTSRPSAQQIQKEEAAASSIRHSGPIAERHQTVLERYMRAIEVEHLPDATGDPPVPIISHATNVAPGKGRMTLRPHSPAGANRRRRLTG